MYAQQRWEYKLAVGSDEDFPEYVGPEEGRVDDEERLIALERALDASPFVRHVEVNTPVPFNTFE
jgi:hypothetical protein